jgi:hypothetical protein
MSITPSVYAKARSEIIALFGWNADSLSPDQTLRIDCAVALRLALDDLQGRVVRGESIDTAKMLAHKESPAEAGQGLSWKENQDEETGTDTQIAAVLRLGSQGSAPRTRPVAPSLESRSRRAWDG